MCCRMCGGSSTKFSEKRRKKGDGKHESEFGTWRVFDSGDATPLCDCHDFSQSRKAAFLENLLLSEVIFATDAPELLLTDLTFKKNTPTLQWMSKVSKKKKDVTEVVRTNNMSRPTCSKT